MRRSGQGRKLDYELTPRASPSASSPQSTEAQVRRGVGPEANDRDSRGQPMGGAKGNGMPLLRDSGTVSPNTEITVLGGGCYRVEGDPKAVERTILDAARGSIMEIAWFVEAASGERIGINPECVVALRAIDS